MKYYPPLFGVAFFCDHLRPIINRSHIGCGQVVLSRKMGDFVDEKLFLRSASRKKAVFLDESVADKKETPHWDVSISGVEQGGTVEKPWPPVAS